MGFPALRQTESGFLGTGSNSSIHTFEPEKKITFIELARKFWPDVQHICDAIGIHRATFDNHMKWDVKFCNEIVAIKLAKLDKIKTVMMQEAEKPKGFLDRAMTLRAYEPETFDRAKVVKIEGYKMNAQERSTRLGSVESAVDATIVQAYSTRKERQQAKRLKAAEKREGLGKGGEGG